MEQTRHDAEGVVNEMPAHGIEARRWTVVFHRKAENWFFGLIAMGHFKHVSAFAWLPELSIWVFYDVGFRRTRLVHMADGQFAQATIGNLCQDNATVTVAAREDGLPLMRWGLFCTTAVAHLLGLSCVALRPDALYRRLIASGGHLIDNGSPHPTPGRRRPEPAGPASRGADYADLQPANPGPG
jgi:hypothetical protein